MLTNNVFYLYRNTIIGRKLSSNLSQFSPDVSLKIAWKLNNYFERLRMRMTLEKLISYLDFSRFG